MQKLGLLLLLLCGLYGAEPQTPDLLSMVTSLMGQIVSLQTQVQSLQSQVQKLESGAAQQPTASPVAFFAGLRRNPHETGGFHGPFPMESTIKYMNVVTNIGNAYDPVTGMFRAPVKGVYVFHFSAFNTGVIAPENMAVPKKNGEPLPSALDGNTRNNQPSATRVAVVTLEAGDTVCVDLPARATIYDGYRAQNSFSGFLLSPM